MLRLKKVKIKLWNKKVENLIDEINIKIDKIEKELNTLKNNEFEIISQNSNINNKIQIITKRNKG